MRSFSHVRKAFTACVCEGVRGGLIPIMTAIVTMTHVDVVVLIEPVSISGRTEPSGRSAHRPNWSPLLTHHRSWADAWSHAHRLHHRRTASGRRWLVHADTGLEKTQKIRKSVHVCYRLAARKGLNVWRWGSEGILIVSKGLWGVPGRC